jgi:hypothetical protein
VGTGVPFGKNRQRHEDLVCGLQHVACVVVALAEIPVAIGVDGQPHCHIFSSI